MKYRLENLGNESKITLTGHFIGIKHFIFILISDVPNNLIRLESAFRRDRMSDFLTTDSSVSHFPTFEYEQALSQMSDFRQPTIEM